MILRKHRFHGHNSLRYVYSEGRTVRGNLLAIRTVVNSRRKDYRAAVVVSKKVSKSAVVRNRIRRRIYELIRTEISDAASPVDMVITVYSDQVAEVPHGELKVAIQKLLKQSGVID